MTSDSNTFAALREAFNHVRIEEAAVDFNYTPHVRKICYEDAIVIALEHQIKNPRWFVCGSLALMLTGIMKPGDVSDIDFVTNEFPSGTFYSDKRIKYNAQKSTASSYYHCEYSEYVDLFIHSRPVSTYHPRYRGLLLQNIQDVIKWKRHFNRDKDKDDLMQIHLPESLFEI